MSKPTAAARVPGAPTPDPVADAPVAPVEALTPEEMAAQLAAQSQQIAALLATVQKLAEGQSPAAKVANEVSLPDASDFNGDDGKIDWAKVGDTVLTKQGWLVNPKAFFNPALQKT